jgi:uncharacterized Tic20 family protein
MESKTTPSPEKTWAMLCHFGAFAGFIFPFGNIIVPLIIWQIKQHEIPGIEKHGKEVVNFQISTTIYFLVAAFLSILLIGIPLLIVLVIFEIIVIIQGGIKANNGEFYKYPLNIHFIK